MQRAQGGGVLGLMRGTRMFATFSQGGLQRCCRNTEYVQTALAILVMPHVCKVPSHTF